MDDRKQKVEGYFDDIARDYARLYEDREDFTRFPSGPVRLSKALQLLQQFKPTGRVLDIGCGTGHTVLEIVKLGHDAVGIDISSQMVEQSAALLKQNGFEARTQFRVGDVERMPVEDSSVDAVVALGLIEYLTGDDRLVAEIRRVLRPGGVAIVAFRNRLFNLFSLNDYTQQEIVSGEIGKLLADYRAEVSQSPAPAYGPFIEQIQEHAAALGRRDGAAPPAAPLKPLPIHLRQHTPREAREVFSKQGLSCAVTRYFHFHPFPPSHERTDPVAFNRLAVAMETLDQTAVGALMASAFLMVFQA